MLNLYRDVKYSIRQLRRSPAFLIAATLTLGLGMGASTAAFSVIDGLLLESLPFRDAGRIVSILETHPQLPHGSEVTYPDYQEWRLQQTSFEQIAAYSTLNPSTVSLNADGRSTQLNRVLASGNFFSLLGVSPLMGRTILEQDDKPGNDHVAVLSAEAWERCFGRDPDVVGKIAAVNGEKFTVIGVLPPGSGYPGNGEIWLPLSLLDRGTQTSRVWHSVRVLGRLGRGISPAVAASDMGTIAARIAAANPATNRNVGVLITPLRDQLVGALQPVMLAAAGSVALVFLIACTNVASLLRIRSIANLRELGIRHALGASQQRLISQSFALAFVLCLLGASLGTLLAWLVLPLLKLALSHTPGIDLAMIQTVHLHTPALLFVSTICCLATIAFTSMSVLGQSNDSFVALTQGNRGNTSSHGYGRGLLISGEIAVAVVVVLLSTLVSRSFLKLMLVDPGFRADHLLSFEIALPSPKYQAGAPPANQFYDSLLEKISHAPGVVAAAGTTALPLAPSDAMTRFLIEGAPPLSPGTFPMAQIRFVSPDYFRTMGISVLRGRIFNQDELDRQAPLFVVNQTFADHYLQGRAIPTAKVILGVLSASPQRIPVIGVVSNAHDLGIDKEPEPELYLPGFGLDDIVLVRTNSDPNGMVQTVRRAVEELDPAQPIFHVQSIDELLDDSLSLEKATAVMLFLFGALSLALAVVGIYGVLTYSITQRTREIGVRMAVGANRRDIVRMIVAQAFKSFSVGIAVGLTAAVLAARVVRGLLFNTPTFDPLSICIAILVLTIAAAIAVAMPAQRAASISPAEAMRAE
jgi:predicted permease